MNIVKRFHRFFQMFFALTAVVGVSTVGLCSSAATTQNSISLICSEIATYTYLTGDNKNHGLVASPHGDGMFLTRTMGCGIDLVSRNVVDDVHTPLKLNSGQYDAGFDISSPTPNPSPTKITISIDRRTGLCVRKQEDLDKNGHAEGVVTVSVSICSNVDKKF